MTYDFIQEEMEVLVYFHFFSIFGENLLFFSDEGEGGAKFLYSPFFGMGFNCLKAGTTSRRQFKYSFEKMT